MLTLSRAGSGAMLVKQQQRRLTSSPMCLLPGTLSREVSRPNAAARRRAGWLSVMSWLLLLLAALRVLSFSIWSALSDAGAGLYGLAMVRANFVEGEERIVMLENVLCFGLFLALLTAVDALTLATIITRTQLLQSELLEWQVITGIVVSGAALAVYLAAGITTALLYRSLKETLVVAAEETHSFVDPHAGRVGGAGGRHHEVGGGLFGAAFPSVTAVGRVAPAAAAGPPSTSSASRFPGKAYRLGGTDDDQSKPSGS